MKFIATIAPNAPIAPVNTPIQKLIKSNFHFMISPQFNIINLSSALVHPTYITLRSSELRK